jgi:aspartate 1-decarboxylase
MPLRTFLRAKIHRATVTAADPEYVGSISIDPKLLAAAGIVPFEQVDVYNVDNGERLTTYAIEGEPGQVCLNGAAARKAEPGQRVIIAAYALLRDDEVGLHVPRIVICGPGNVMISRQ